MENTDPDLTVLHNGTSLNVFGCFIGNDADNEWLNIKIRLSN